MVGKVNYLQCLNPMLRQFRQKSALNLYYFDKKNDNYKKGWCGGN
ncbi:MAG: hypothetical protein AVDCRST_MAG56-8184 [uncultured Cytophagales bacterium]|uniref:Uncharacterized protein n=1 Tax=uncultured Cytophagales bacterium TaxID=158755 RepID=A0A6J4M291_9SPHI|nr:MAG: hypothetical protein AVDCRST_MAG56-8184 [uncultured Cytophagales bacterium]